MNNQLTNLLPPERQHALSRDYVLRLCTVAAVVIALLTVAAGVLLLPSYVFLTRSEGSKQARLSIIETVLSSADDAAISARLAALSGEASQLMKLKNEPSASGTMRAILAVSRPGVTIFGITYTRASGATPGAVSISGTAATRDALRSYQLALEHASFVAAANLPVSAFAKDANISFTIEVILTSSTP